MRATKLNTCVFKHRVPQNLLNLLCLLLSSLDKHTGGNNFVGICFKNPEVFYRSSMLHWLWLPSPKANWLRRTWICSRSSGRGRSACWRTPWTTSLPSMTSWLSQVIRAPGWDIITLLRAQSWKGVVWTRVLQCVRLLEGMVLSHLTWDHTVPAEVWQCSRRSGFKEKTLYVPRFGVAGWTKDELPFSCCRQGSPVAQGEIEHGYGRGRS